MSFTYIADNLLHLYQGKTTGLDRQHYSGDSSISAMEDFLVSYQVTDLNSLSATLRKISHPVEGTCIMQYTVTRLIF